MKTDTKTDDLFKGLFEVNEHPGNYLCDRLITEEEIIEMAKKIARSKLSKGQVITSPDIAADYFQQLLGDKKNETFGVLFLNNQHEVLEYSEMFTGSISSAAVHPRVVVQRALELNASAVTLCHNHPSGSLEASSSDRNITDQLRKILELVEVRILDHFIVTQEGYLSFAQEGMI